MVDTDFSAFSLIFCSLFSSRYFFMYFCILVHFLIIIFSLILWMVKSRCDLSTLIEKRNFLVCPRNTELTYILLILLAHWILIFLFSFAITSRWFRADYLINIFLLPRRICLEPISLGACLSRKILLCSLKSSSVLPSTNLAKL